MLALLFGAKSIRNPSSPYAKLADSKGKTDCRRRQAKGPGRPDVLGPSAIKKAVNRLPKGCAAAHFAAVHLRRPLETAEKYG